QRHGACAGAIARIAFEGANPVYRGDDCAAHGNNDPQRQELAPAELEQRVAGRSGHIPFPFVLRPKKCRRSGRAKSDNMSNKMWGGRFRTGPDAVMEEINASIDVDRHLFREDIAASKAHAAMLAKQGIITAKDARAIAHGLDTILSEIESGNFKFARALEDIHMNVENRLAELIGPAAGRLHTARSRNDQVATDF